MFDLNNGFAIGDPASSQWRYYITTTGGASYSLGANTPSAANSTEAGWVNSYWAIDTGHIGWGTNNSRIYHGGWRGPITYTTTVAQNQLGFAFEYNCVGYDICMSNAPSPLALEKTTNCGNNWNTLSYIPPSVPWVIRNAPTIGVFEYWIGAGLGIYYSSNGGANWSTQFAPSASIFAMSMVNVQCGWAGGASGQIWKYSSPHPIEVSNKQNEVPNEYRLSQNYPNPFNPSTTINYQLPITNYVKLVVYDILGNVVSILVDQKMNAGNHSVEFDGSKLPSGVYFYKLFAGDFTESKKMVVVK